MTLSDTFPARECEAPMGQSPKTPDPLSNWPKLQAMLEHDRTRAAMVPDVVVRRRFVAGAGWVEQVMTPKPPPSKKKDPVFAKTVAKRRLKSRMAKASRNLNRRAGK
jgi:hypothetical protein